MLNHTSILITGGTGSFGQAFLRYILKHYEPQKVVIFSRDELKQSLMQQEFPMGQYPIRYFLGDVRDAERLQQAMIGIDYVVHAAALKQVPSSEYNPFECVKTNVLGAQNVINAAIYNGVKKVIALSTDKAVNPINLYGATKLAADKMFVSSNHMSAKQGCRFSVVRYGNVIGSRGSVIPFFLECRKRGEKVLPITDLRMTRFWITLTQGVEFVIHSLKNMSGGEIFVPKIPSMKMVDVAKTIIPTCDFKVVGIRPGEKLHEALISPDDARYTFEMENGYLIRPSFQWWTLSTNKVTGGKEVPENFEFRSDKNPYWLTSEKLLKLIS